MPLSTTTAVSCQSCRIFSSISCLPTSSSSSSIDERSLKMTDLMQTDHASGPSLSPYASNIRKSVWIAPQDIVSIAIRYFCQYETYYSLNQASHQL